MALPFLPGNNFNPALGKSKYHKSHHFDYANEVSMHVGQSKPGIGGDPLLGQVPKPNVSSIPRGTGSDQPAWVAFDRQVLSFDAYFQEAVHERREEQFRIRNCKIYLYLEDDSIQVVEPRIKNAGIPQGTIIRRHRIPKPPPQDDQFYTIEDFNIGKNITFYSRTFEITNCDKFTENFLGKLGMRVNKPKDGPGDPYTNHRKALEEGMEPLRPYEKYDTLKQFLDHDRQVLRFFCYWDDTDNMFGDTRDMILHYFLADDTIEVREVIPPNCGRDATPMFLQRARLPKEVIDLKQPGVATNRTILNVFGPTGHGGRYILDSLKTGATSTEHYTEADLTLGTVLNIWGRPIVLCDCDEFTKEYYRTKYGVTNFTPVQYRAPEPAEGKRQNPPYNGFGSEEDSLSTCKGLMPKAPKRDFIKFMEKDSRGLESNVLRFLAKMDTDKPIDMDRRFIISYFLSDDTILVYEPPIRNSGIIGGKFLERCRVKKPNQPRFGTDHSQYYLAQDLFVGANVQFNNHLFILIDADEYAYNFMEGHSGKFTSANVGAIMDKLRELGKDQKDLLARQANSATSGLMPLAEFKAVLQSLAHDQLSEQELHTIARFYADRPKGGVSMETLIGLAQDQLIKTNFEEFTGLREHLTHLDEERKGYLTANCLRSAFRGFKVPIADDLLRALLSRFEEENGINYENVIQHLNWRKAPVTLPVQLADNAMSLQDLMCPAGTNTVTIVNYGLLLYDLFNIGNTDTPSAPC